MAKAPDLKSGGPGFNFRFEHYLAGVALGSPEFNSLATLVNSQLVCLPPVGVLKDIMFIWIIFFIVPKKLLKGSCQLSNYYYYQTKEKCENITAMFSSCNPFSS